MLAPTYEVARAADYRRPGGAWDRPTLDALLTDATPDALQAAVAGVAGGLRAAGVRPGDVVAWQAPNRPEVVLAYRACWRIGAVAAPIHHQAGADEATRIVEALAPRAVLDLDALPLGQPVTEHWSEPEQLAAVLWTS
ncbi:MAG: AMP-binding protein, partial [Acidimicrobiia bacterium]